MPAFGGSVRAQRPWISWRAMVSAGVGVVAAGLLLCAMVVGQHAMYPRTDELTSRNDNVIASMQGQVQHQLLEAAKRHALAEKHEVQSVKLDNAALQEREQAELLKRRATLAKSEAELERARDDVKTAHSKLEVLQSKSDTLLSTARADKSGADDAKEEVMQLEDKAAALSQKAALEEDKIKLVESKQNKAAAALPKLLKDAETEELEASEMKAEAQKRMADSQRKAAAAKRLDAIAAQRIHDAHVVRNKIMNILEQKTKILEQKEKDVSLADEMAKKEAQVEADRARKFADEAAERAQLAENAQLAKAQASREAKSDADSAPESKAETPAPEPKAETPAPESEADKQRDAEIARLEAEARAADAADDVDAATAAKLNTDDEAKQVGTQELHVVEPRDPNQAKVQWKPEHSGGQLHAVRANNLQRAAMETERRLAILAGRPGREQELADVSKTVTGDEVGENEEGRLVMRKRVALARTPTVEDGHYSRREEAFKQALAAAYRAGYNGQERHTELRAHTSVKPARMQMLGDVTPAALANAGSNDGLFTVSQSDSFKGVEPAELLSTGAGSSVKLEKEADNKTPLFSMLWTDPGSLKADTEDLVGTTRSLHRYAPVSRGTSLGLSKAMLDKLYEDGHRSREEDGFKQDMGKYRSALKEEREVHEEKVKRLDEELAELPAAGRSTGNWKEDREQTFATLLHQPQGQWSSHGDRAYSHTQKQALLALPTVHEDEEGHLVFKQHQARMQLLHEYAGRRVRVHRGDGDGDDRKNLDEGGGKDISDTVQRVREELARERRRDRRLEDVTEKLQGEVDILRQERSDGGRTQELVQLRHEHEGREGESSERAPERDDRERRRRVEGARGRIRHYHARAHGGGRGQEPGDAKFHPDNTYNKEYAWDPGHVSVGEIKFQHALKDFDRTKSILREGAQVDEEHFHMPQLVPSHLPGQGL